MPQPRRLIIAPSGSTGPHYGVRLLEVLRAQTKIETHLVLPAAASKTIEYEMGRDPKTIAVLADKVHDERNVASAIASGTFVTGGMVVAPYTRATPEQSAIAYKAFFPVWQDKVPRLDPQGCWAPSDSAPARRSGR